MKFYKSACALALSGCMLLSSTAPCFASAAFESPAVTNNEIAKMNNIFRGDMYEVTEDCVVRDAPQKSGQYMFDAQAGTYVVGTVVSNGRGNQWLKFYTEENEAVYIYMDHLKLHQHNYVAALEYKGNTADEDHYFEVCECGYGRIVYSGDYYVECDVDDVACHLLAGSYTDSSNVIADAITLGYDATTVAVCSFAGATLNPYAGTACGILSVISWIASARDLTADVAHENYAGAAIDTLGLGLDMGSSIKALESNRLIKYGSNVFTAATLTSDTVQVFCDLGDCSPSISDVSAPTGTLAFGNYFSIGGTIHLKNSDASQIVVEILDNQGNSVYQYSAKVTDGYALLNSNFDANMRFDLLSRSNYKYRVYAIVETDTGNACVRTKQLLAESDFTVQ